MSRICFNNFHIFKRKVHGNAEIVQNCTEIRNRNPRNLERLRIARKPMGYVLDNVHESYWHKLVVTPTQRYVTAEIHHYENGAVISVSSQEWGIKKQLYSGHDIMAFKSVGRVLAQRCLESGIVEVYVNTSKTIGKKVQNLLNELTENGICLREPERYKHPFPTFRYRPEKPWESYE